MQHECKAYIMLDGPLRPTLFFIISLQRCRHKIFLRTKKRETSVSRVYIMLVDRGRMPKPFMLHRMGNCYSSMVTQEGVETVKVRIGKFVNQALLEMNREHHGSVGSHDLEVTSEGSP